MHYGKNIRPFNCLIHVKYFLANVIKRNISIRLKVGSPRWNMCIFEKKSNDERSVYYLNENFE
jgi:hypothetical protein